MSHICGIKFGDLHFFQKQWAGMTLLKLWGLYDLIRTKEANVYEPINLQWYLQYVSNLQKIHKIVINLVHKLLLHKELRRKNHAIKLSTSSDSLVQKICQVEDCKGYKIAKICLRCGKYLCGKCTFDNKIICKKCSKVE